MKKDIFGHNTKLNKFLNLEKDFGIVIEFGKNNDDTVIRTVGGEVLNMVTKFVTNHDAEDRIPTVTLTILNPKFGVKAPEPVEEIQDARLQAAVEKTHNIEDLHKEILKKQPGAISAYVAPKYTESGRLVE